MTHKLIPLTELFVPLNAFSLTWRKIDDELSRPTVGPYITIDTLQTILDASPDSAVHSLFSNHMDVIYTLHAILSAAKNMIAGRTYWHCVIAYITDKVWVANFVAPNGMVQEVTGVSLGDTVGQMCKALDIWETPGIRSDSPGVTDSKNPLPVANSDLRTAALKMQLAVANVLLTGGLDSDKWWDQLAEAQRNLAQITKGTYAEFEELRKQS